MNAVVHRLHPLRSALTGPLLDGLTVGFGRVVVETSIGRGTIVLSEGAIVWVLSDIDTGDRLVDILSRHTSLSRDALREHYAHCRATGVSFMDGLILRELADYAAVWHALRDHNALHLHALRDAEVVSARFEDSPRHYNASFAFSLDELRERPRAQTGVQLRQQVATWMEHGTATGPKLANLRRVRDPE